MSSLRNLVIWHNRFLVSIFKCAKARLSGLLLLMQLSKDAAAQLVLLWHVKVRTDAIDAKV